MLDQVTIPAFTQSQRFVCPFPLSEGLVKFFDPIGESLLQGHHPRSYLDAGSQFSARERLGEIVISTCFLIVARDGDEALAVLERPDAPPLAILDWMMPGRDGIDVCRLVRQSGTATPPCIILLTARSDKDDVVAGKGDNHGVS